MKKVFIIIISLLPFSCSKTYAPLDAVKNVDLNKYIGTWYEIARFPHSFEKGLKCVTATYSFKENGKVKVINKGHKEKYPEKINKAEGIAWVPNKNEPGKLKVSFFWPFSGKYWIIKLDEKDYQYALIGEPSRKYLWVLSRNKTIYDKIFTDLVGTAKKNGFDINKLEKIKHDCN